MADVGDRTAPTSQPLLDNVDFNKPKSPHQALDWIAYFNKFCEQHGGNPLAWKGRILFEDGWSYSSTDHAGPEWPPPVEPSELNSLLKYYWTRRLKIVEGEQESLYQQYNHLIEMQRLRSVPLQMVTTYFDMEAKKLNKEVGPMNLEDMESRISWLDGDIENCKQRLKELS